MQGAGLDSEMRDESLLVENHGTGSARAQSWLVCTGSWWPDRSSIHEDVWRNLKLGKCMSLLIIREIPYWYFHKPPFAQVYPQSHIICLILADQVLHAPSAASLHL